MRRLWRNGMLIGPRPPAAGWIRWTVARRVRRLAAQCRSTGPMRRSRAQRARPAQRGLPGPRAAAVTGRVDDGPRPPRAGRPRRRDQRAGLHVHGQRPGRRQPARSARHDVGRRVTTRSGDHRRARPRRAAPRARRAQAQGSGPPRERTSVGDDEVARRDPSRSSAPPSPATGQRRPAPGAPGPRRPWPAHRRCAVPARPQPARMRRAASMPQRGDSRSITGPPSDTGRAR